MHTLILILLLLLVHPGIQEKTALQRPVQKIRLVLQHRVGREPLVLGNSYRNVLGDTITIYKFKYYLSNFAVTDSSGNTVRLPLQYRLVDEADAASKTIELSVPVDRIRDIRFMIGVDSTRNVSGIQEGALDPLKGMFWTWNTGYIMAKLEGSSPSSKIAMQSFTYHIGGYRAPYATMRWVTLPAGNRNTNKLAVVVDINQWFKHKTALSIAKTPVCHSPGELASQIADNISGMFSNDSNP
ncbi:MbnP family protein [Sediminibacterium soli]|uniref:MbnP family protein n=1 Tax=Sediminibacterium soli TaxID=2698829 RepID=UPI00137A7770|nr:MbnP family protein [Sediminibacterium soli]NCI45566.1 hypothetical protein [Sediminibacterium soli]